MAKKKKYQEGIRIAKSVGETGKTIVKMKTYFIVGLILISLIVVGVIVIQFTGFKLVNGDEPIPPPPPSPEYDIISPTLEPIVPLISTDVNIELQWDDAEVINSDLLDEIDFSVYMVFRRKDYGTWYKIKTITAFDNVEYYKDKGLAEGTYEYKIQSGFYKPVVIEMHYSEYSDIMSVEVDLFIPPTNPSIIINDGANTTDSLEVILTLSCNYATKMQFEIYGNLLNWVAYIEIYPFTFSQESPDYPIYKVGVIFGNDDGETEIIYDEITHVIESVLEVLPTNPSITINDGAETTNSFENNILTLYCENATEMQFKINDGVWTDWIEYSMTYTIILPENDIGYPDYKVEVVFRNIVGTTEDAGYENVYDEITYNSEGELPPLPPPEDDDKIDYTLTYILIGVLGGAIGIVIFMKVRKNKSKKVHYTTAKGKSRVIKPLKSKFK